MSAREQIAAIYADEKLDDAQKRAAVYRLKTALLIDVSGDLIGRAYERQGRHTLINSVRAGRADELMFDIVLDGFVHQVVIVNPPLIPRAPTGDERADMRQAVVEMLEDLPTEDAP